MNLGQPEGGKKIHGEAAREETEEEDESRSNAGMKWRECQRGKTGHGMLQV